MLVANCEGEKIEACIAEKGYEYTCPKCRQTLTLKKGRIRVHHFAHKPPINCVWGTGETQNHLEAKFLFCNEFRKRGYRVEVEYEICSLPDDRRADVVVWSPNTKRPYTIELQHTPLDYDTLEHRTKSYIRVGVRVIWVPFFRPELWQEAEYPEIPDADYIIHRFPARPMDRWIHGFNYGELWMYDPSKKNMWKTRLEECLIEKEYSQWYNREGDLESAGGYEYPSRRWRKLILWGPYNLNQIRIVSRKRKATEIGGHRYPGGVIGRFVIQEE